MELVGLKFSRNSVRNGEQPRIPAVKIEDTRQDLSIFSQNIEVRSTKHRKQTTNHHHEGQYQSYSCPFLLGRLCLRRFVCLRPLLGQGTAGSMPSKPLVIATNISEYGIEIFIASQDDLNCKAQQDKQAHRETRIIPIPIRKAQKSGRPPIPTNSPWFAA